VSTEAFYEGAAARLGGGAACGALLELAAFLSDAEARCELAAVHAARCSGDGGGGVLAIAAPQRRG